jgi:hypothetical protein
MDKVKCDLCEKEAITKVTCYEPEQEREGVSMNPIVFNVCEDCLQEYNEHEGKFEDKYGEG